MLITYNVFTCSFHDNHFTDVRSCKKGTEVNRPYRIAYVPIRYHAKVKARANPFLVNMINNCIKEPNGEKI